MDQGVVGPRRTRPPLSLGLSFPMLPPQGRGRLFDGSNRDGIGRPSGAATSRVVGLGVQIFVGGQKLSKYLLAPRKRE